MTLLDTGTENCKRPLLNDKPTTVISSDYHACERVNVFK